MPRLDWSSALPVIIRERDWAAPPLTQTEVSRRINFRINVCMSENQHTWL